jgi:vacuolar-type H+-ATPase catalytic subunit A/Vma1
MQEWPTRVTRPVNDKFGSDSSFIVGQRILDVFFPSVQGGAVCISGAFGCGKTVISQSISNFSSSDTIVYAGCVRATRRKIPRFVLVSGLLPAATGKYWIRPLSRVVPFLLNHTFGNYANFFCV